MIFARLPLLGWAALPVPFVVVQSCGGVQLDSSRGRSSPDASDHNANDRLDSWGEIASYLRRGIRTVRRWEQEEGLPVHRHLHRKSGSVYAFKFELDAWWNNRRPQMGSPEEKVPNKRVLRYWWVIALVLVLGAVVAVWVRPLSSGLREKPSGVRAIAVLPFADLSVDSPQHGIFAEAMTEQLITSLAEVMPLRVASRNSVTSYGSSKKALREVAEELNVDAVVRGSVQRVGQQVIITIRLIDARDDRHIWARSYVGDSKGILDFEEKTAQTAANEIRTALNSGHR